MAGTKWADVKARIEAKAKEAAEAGKTIRVVVVEAGK